MFIQIHGTSGSGKTTIMRQIMAGLHRDGEEKITHSWDEKKKGVLTGKVKEKTFTLAEVYSDAENLYRSDADAAPEPTIYVVGTYGSVCGGMDTLSAPGIATPAFKRLAEIDKEDGVVVLMEGLMQMSVPRTIELVEAGHVVHALFLDTPLEECLRRVAKRRTDRGDDRELNPDNTVHKHKEKIRIAERLAEQGVKVEWVNSDTARHRVQEIIRAS